MAPAGRFSLWGPDHLVVLCLVGAGAALILARARRLAPADERRYRWIAGWVLLAGELLGLIIAAAEGRPRLPLQLCDLGLAAMVWALWTLRPGASEFAYFLGMTGSLQAVLTPDVVWAFPDPGCARFFITHGGVVLGSVYLAASGRVQPGWRSVWRMWGLANVYAACAGLVNAAYGTNFGYLVHKPSQPSLLDYFGPWPWYIVGMEAAAWLLLAAAAWPWLARRRLRHHDG